MLPSTEDLITKLAKIHNLLNTEKSNLHTLVCCSVTPHSLYSVQVRHGVGQYLFQLSDSLDQVKFIGNE